MLWLTRILCVRYVSVSACLWCPCPYWRRNYREQLLSKLSGKRRLQSWKLGNKIRKKKSQILLMWDFFLTLNSRWLHHSYLHHPACFRLLGLIPLVVALVIFYLWLIVRWVHSPYRLPGWSSQLVSAGPDLLSSARLRSQKKTNVVQWSWRQVGGLRWREGDNVNILSFLGVQILAGILAILSAVILVIFFAKLDDLISRQYFTIFQVRKIYHFRLQRQKMISWIEKSR